MGKTAPVGIGTECKNESLNNYKVCLRIQKYFIALKACKS